MGKITKKDELRKKFNIWLGDKFDIQHKRTFGETRRWLFCWNQEPAGTFAGDCFDCACCLSDVEEKGCKCICHERITQIVDFFWKEINKRDKK